ncbi:MAG: hypothetical protein M3P42_09200 [Actinomycetota bacterium]|nr:hypothetical protein [Actinomycetota bacterium]
MDALIVQELVVASDYGQIYVGDPEGLDETSPQTEEDNSLQRSLDDAHESRRFVGYDGGTVNILTPSQYNWTAPLRLEVFEEPPPLDADGWDHIAEVPLPAPSGKLYFQASGGGTLHETMISPGIYRARISGRDFVAGVGEIEGRESWRIQLWPAEESEPSLLKYWDGWDLMSPAEPL